VYYLVVRLYRDYMTQTMARLVLETDDPSVQKWSKKI
jgi:hypothetical protein